MSKHTMKILLTGAVALLLMMVAAACSSSEELTEVPIQGQPIIPINGTEISQAQAE